MTKYIKKFRVTVGDQSTGIWLTQKHLDDDDHLQFLRREWVPVLARDRAITKLFGKRAFWHANSGVEGMGQVFVSDDQPGSSAYSVTNLVRLDVEEIGGAS